MIQVAKGCHLSLSVRSIKTPGLSIGLEHAGRSPKRTGPLEISVKDSQKHFRVTLVGAVMLDFSAQTDVTNKRSISKKGKIRFL